MSADACPGGRPRADGRDDAERGGDPDKEEKIPSESEIKRGYGGSFGCQSAPHGKKQYDGAGGSQVYTKNSDGYGNIAGGDSPDGAGSLQSVIR